MTLLRESPEWADVLAYNEFSLYVTTKKPAPWQKVGGGNWTDYDDSRTTEWLQRHDVLVPTPLTAEAVQTVAKENRFHPVRDYLNSLEWDQTPRLDNWLSEYLGVEPSPFVAAVGTRWMISAVARIFRPGCQADYTLLFEGKQGIQKSKALQILAGDDWFTDHISDLGSKDSRIELHGKWIIEFSELATVRRGELEKVKAFLTARIDHFRMPYGRRSEAVPRSCVFAASVNDQTPFTDPTGNRRWWPVRCGVIAIGALRRDRDQLWAEAYARFKAGQVWYLETAELNQLATSEQDERYDPGVWDEVILDWIENPTQRLDFEDHNAVGIPIEPYNSDETRVTVTDVLLHCIGKPLDQIKQPDQNQVVRCLIHAGWKRKQTGKGPERGKWFYLRPDVTSVTSMSPVL
jgi:putative DNA primase/helicase